MADRGPRVSVVMSVYDGAEHLPAALASVLDQELADFELLVVDDGSRDATPDILAAVTDPRVHVIRQRNEGCVAAWHAAIARARAPLVARMDADDVCAPSRLARQVAFLDAHPEVALVGTGGRVIDDDGRTIRLQQTYCRDFALRLRLTWTNAFVHGSVVFRREVFDRVGGYRAERFPAEDYDLWCRIARTGAAVANLPDELYLYREHAGTISTTQRDRQQQAARAVRDEHAPHLLRQVLAPDAIRRAAKAYADDPDPRVRAEWPVALGMLERLTARELRAGRLDAARAATTALAVAPVAATTVALHEGTRWLAARIRRLPRARRRRPSE